MLQSLEPEADCMCTGNSLKTSWCKSVSVTKHKYLLLGRYHALLPWVATYICMHAHTASTQVHIHSPSSCSQACQFASALFVPPSTIADWQPLQIGGLSRLACLIMHVVRDSSCRTDLLVGGPYLASTSHAHIQVACNALNACLEAVWLVLAAPACFFQIL